MISALAETNNLFSQLAKEVAKIREFDYPENAVDYARNLFEAYFGNEL